MIKKTAAFNIKGMSRDLAFSKFSPESAFEIQNMRFSTKDSNSVGVLTTERGTKHIGDTLDLADGAVPIGLIETNDGFVLFSTTGTNDTAGSDYIDFYNIENGVLTKTALYDSSDLEDDSFNFRKEYPLECMYWYENSEVEKIYFTDNYNQPRVINIKDTSNNSSWGKTSNFTPILNSLDSTLTITKQEGAGLFPSGVVQYFYTYYTPYGSESHIINCSPLYYIARTDRAEAADTNVECSFEITISNLQEAKPYNVRVYSLIRTSLDAVPTIKKILDSPIPNNGTITFRDTNLYGESVGPDDALYLGSELIKTSTFDVKDNTLFLGNITKLQEPIEKDDIDIDPDEVSCNLRGPKLYTSPVGYFTKYTPDYVRDGEDARTLKYLEWYRLGVQFQHKSGKWSNVIYVGDKQMTEAPYNYISYGEIINHNEVSLPIFKYTFSAEDLEAIYSKDYIRVRAVIVNPDVGERCCVTQGIACPTVYNVRNRHNNKPYAQASWFSRPNSCYLSHLTAPIEHNNSRTCTLVSASVLEETGLINNSYIPGNMLDPRYTSIVTNAGVWAEFRHDYPIPSSHKTNGEIQCQFNPPFSIDEYNEQYDEYFYIDRSIITVHTPEIYFNEQIPTLGDINFNNLKCRILGYVPLQSHYSEYNITASAPKALLNHNPWVHGLISSKDVNLKYLEEDSEYTWKTTSTFGWHHLINCGLWAEYIQDPNDPYYQADAVGIYSGIADNTVWQRIITGGKSYSTVLASFIIYPWNQQRLANYGPDDTQGQIKNKTLSVLQYSGLTTYLPVTSTSNLPSVLNNLEVDTTNVFKDNLVKLDDKVYLGDVDTIISPSKLGTYSRLGFVELNTADKKYIIKSNGYPYIIAGISTDTWENQAKRYLYNDEIPYAETPNSIENSFFYGDALSMSSLSAFELNVSCPLLTKKKYESSVSYGSELINQDQIFGYVTSSSENRAPISTFYDEDYNKFISTALNDTQYGLRPITKTATSDYPISMKYKTTPHIVSRFKKERLQDEGYQYYTQQWILPYSEYTNGSKYRNSLMFCDNASVGSWKVINKDTIFDTEPLGDHLLSDINITNDQNDVYIGYHSTQIRATAGTGFLWLLEYYRDTPPTFGGNSEAALQNNNWLVAGPAVDIDGENDTEVEWWWGDSYYQRFDCLRVYPYEEESQNSIVNVVSYMCESHINLDGRYDRNREVYNLANIRPENYNLLNPAYSQSNNFFPSRYINADIKEPLNFENLITWTLPKVNGSITDNFTHITLASTEQCDGTKGTLTKLINFNNQLLAIQEIQTSQVKYNEDAAISTNLGIPVELANSGRVSGIRPLFNYGTTNKYAIAKSQNALYFVDDSTKELLKIDSNGIRNLSNTLGLNSYFNEQVIYREPWLPDSTLHRMQSMKLYYDKVNEGLLSINKQYCLEYSEKINAFSSFFSYENVPYIGKIGNRQFALYYDNDQSNAKYKLYELQAGDYGYFFNSSQNSSLSFIVNENATINKTFTTLNFEADSYVAVEIGSEDLTYNPKLTFRTIQAGNEYQNGVKDLMQGTSRTLGWTKELRKKFRVWHANIPRDEDSRIIGRIQDRMSNPWLKITLIDDQHIVNHKTVLNNLSVDYYV